MSLSVIKPDPGSKSRSAPYLEHIFSWARFYSHIKFPKNLSVSFCVTSIFEADPDQQSGSKLDLDVQNEKKCSLM